MSPPHMSITSRRIKLSFVKKKWVQLEIIILSELGQSQTNRTSVTGFYVLYRYIMKEEMKPREQWRLKGASKGRAVGCGFI